MIGSVWIPTLLIVPSAYVLVLLVAGVVLDGSAWRVASALMTMHFSWGVGFLAGALEGT
jgi:hypothetical protein